jgi:hypothetical protein
VAEWLKAPVSKTGIPFTRYREFESLPVRFDAIFGAAARSGRGAIFFLGVQYVVNEPRDGWPSGLRRTPGKPPESFTRFAGLAQLTEGNSEGVRSRPRAVRTPSVRLHTQTHTQFWLVDLGTENCESYKARITVGGAALKLPRNEAIILGLLVTRRLEMYGLQLVDESGGRLFAFVDETNSLGWRAACVVIAVKRTATPQGLSHPRRFATPVRSWVR